MRLTSPHLSNWPRSAPPCGSRPGGPPAASNASTVALLRSSAFSWRLAPPGRDADRGQCEKCGLGRGRRLLAAAWLALAALAAVAARAEPITLQGVNFSDELGGFVLLGGSGSGTPADPFVVLERIVTNAPTVLVIRGVDLEFGNPVRTNHFVGFAMIKVVENATGDTFDLSGGRTTY